MNAFVMHWLDYVNGGSHWLRSKGVAAGQRCAYVCPLQRLLCATHHASSIAMPLPTITRPTRATRSQLLRAMVVSVSRR
jgi:hypothetical protein